MSITSTGIELFDYTITSISSDTLPEGNEEWTPPPGITSGGIDTYSYNMGAGAEGLVKRGTSFAPGNIIMVYGGEEVLSKPLSDETYKVSFVPPGVEDGDDVSRGTNEVRYLGEDGSVVTKQFSGSLFITFDVSLGDLTVTVEDVDGNPVAKDYVTIEGSRFTTDENGQINVGASGTATIDALGKTISRDVNVPAGGSVSTTFTYSGISGKVRSAGNDPIKDARVTLKDSDGNVLERTFTDEFGLYSFTEVPLSIDVEVSTGEISRSFTSAGSGSELTRNLPFDTSGIASIFVDCRDSESGRSVSSTPLTAGSFFSRTDNNGVGGVNFFEGGELTMEVAKGDERYETTEVTVNVTLGQVIEEEVELDRKLQISNV